MKFFLDHNLPPGLAKALRSLYEPEGFTVEHLTDRFECTVSDTDWITALGEEGGWVAFTRDTGIKKKKQELRVWRESGLTVFFLKKAWSGAPRHRLLERFIGRWEEFVQLAQKRAGGGWLVPLRGKIERLPD